MRSIISPSTCSTAASRLRALRTSPGIGIANQRETVVFWDRRTGDPVCPAIVWQCRRTSDFCSRIPEEMRRLIRERTGLQTDAYFSASKIRWGLDHVPAAARLCREGNLCVGTVDSFLIWKLTEEHAFVTDHTNASRTMLFNIHTLKWDADLLSYFGIREDILPEVRPCTARMGEFLHSGVRIPVAGVAGDQQAALFGQGVPCPRGRQDHVRHGALSALQYGQIVRRVRPRTHLHRRILAGQEGGLCAGGQRIQCGQLRAMAAR